jgi:hypothetical protein
MAELQTSRKHFFVFKVLRTVFICRYSWTQTLPLAEVFIPLAKGTSARQCSVSITQDSLCVKVNNEVLLGSFCVIHVTKSMLFCALRWETLR